MAFTQPQRAKIRFYLGYSLPYGNIYTALDYAIDSAGALPDTQDLIEEILGQLDSVVEPVVSTTTTSVGALKRVDEVEYYDAGSDSTQSDAINSLGRMYVHRMSIILGIPVLSDVFASAPTTRCTSLY